MAQIAFLELQNLASVTFCVIFLFCLSLSDSNNPLNAHIRSFKKSIAPEERNISPLFRGLTGARRRRVHRLAARKWAEWSRRLGQERPGAKRTITFRSRRTM